MAGVEENDVFYYKDMRESEMELTRDERSALAKKQAIAMKKRRCVARESTSGHRLL